MALMPALCPKRMSRSRRGARRRRTSLAVGLSGSLLASSESLVASSVSWVGDLTYTVGLGGGGCGKVCHKCCSQI